MRKKLGRFVSLGLVGVMVMSTLITGCGASGEDDVASGSAVEEVTEEETEEVAEEPEELFADYEFYKCTQGQAG